MKALLLVTGIFFTQTSIAQQQFRPAPDQMSPPNTYQQQVPVVNPNQVSVQPTFSSQGVSPTASASPSPSPASTPSGVTSPTPIPGSLGNGRSTNPAINPNGTTVVPPQPGMMNMQPTGPNGSSPGSMGIRPPSFP